MGPWMSVVQKDIYRDFKLKLACKGKKSEKKDLQNLILSVCENFPGSTKDLFYLVNFWNLAGKNLYNSSANWSHSAQKLTHIFQKIYGMVTLEEEEQSKREKFEGLKEAQESAPALSVYLSHATEPDSRHGAEKAYACAQS